MQWYQGKTNIFYHLSSFPIFFLIFASAYKMRTWYARKVVITMNTLGHLEKMLLAGEISESEYKKKKAVYVETILELYIKDIITETEMKEKLNQ